MAKDDKLKNKIDQWAGQVKEAAGRATSDEQLRREGTAQKDKAQLQEKVADVVDKAKDIFKK